MTGPTHKLVDRPDDAILFHTPGRSIDAGSFLADAAGLAATLPCHAHVANLCQDRYWFAAGFAACLLRGQVSLLSGDPSSGMLTRLSQDYPDLYILTDLPSLPQALDPGSLPTHRVPERIGSWRAALHAAPAISAGQLAVVVLTSGTTGNPIGTRKCWGELVTRSRAAAERFALHEIDPVTLLGTVPPAHMYGLETTVLLPLHAGASSWCGPAFYPADIVTALNRLAGPRVLVTTPLHLRALLCDSPPGRPPERVISATAPLERAMAEMVERAWGTQVLEIFGATELGSIASRRTVAEESWTLYPGLSLRPASAGRAAGTPFLHAPHTEPRPLSDRVELLDDGCRFRLFGRTSDLVKLGGRRASLLGLGRILTGIDGVRDGVFLAPDDLDRRSTARLAAFAVAPGHTVASLTAALRVQIDPVFLPRPLVLLDALPRDALGKLPRAALLAKLAPREP